MSALEFRRQALDAQARIDQLPSSMSVTSGLTRAAMSFLAVLLGGAAVWSAFVEVPVQIDGAGVFVDTSGELLNAVRAPMDGVVEAILVTEGDNVNAGRVVARLRLPERLAALQQAERDLASLREKAVQREKLTASESDSAATARAVRRAAIEQRIENLERQLEWRRQLEQAQVTLTGRGVTTASRLHEAQIATQTTVDDLATARSELQSLTIEPLLEEATRHRERLADAMAVEEKESEIIALRSELERGAELRSPVHGVVAEISAERNGLVGAGQPVLSVIPANFDKVLDAIVYVPLKDGKMVEVGHQVYIAPHSMPAREQGRLRGTVMEISEAPITDDALRRTLGNAALAESTAEGGAPFAVRVALHRDPTTVTGYAWTSGDGPDMRVTPGTPFASRITVERETLLTLALPALRGVLDAVGGL